MDRRSFVRAAGLAGLTLSIEGPGVELAQSQSTASEGANHHLLRPARFGLSKKYSDISLQKALPNQARGQGEAPANTQPQPPLSFLYYDTTTKQFSSPVDLTPSLTDKAKKYKLDATLHSFGAATGTEGLLRQINGDVQLGVNVGAPTANDALSWLFMSAVDVFLQKGDQTRQQALAKFQNYSPTSSLKPQSQIVIPGDTVMLQVSAYGQKKQSVWAQLLHVASKVAGSPLLGAIAIPSLVSEALNFVDSALTQLSQKNPLLPIWQTMPATFGIFKDTTELYRFKPGIWVLVDSSYAIQTSGLRNHQLELSFGTFQLLDTASKPANANYLVSEFKLTPQ